MILVFSVEDWAATEIGTFSVSVLIQLSTTNHKQEFMVWLCAEEGHRMS
jgi:hypothetical protein